MANLSIALQRQEGRIFNSCIDISTDVCHEQINEIFEFRLNYKIFFRIFNTTTTGSEKLAFTHLAYYKFKDIEPWSNFSFSNLRVSIPDHLPSEQHIEYCFKKLQKEDDFLDIVVNYMSKNLVENYIVRSKFAINKKFETSLNNFEVKELKYNE